MALKVGPERERTLRRMPDASNAAPPVGRHDVANQSCVFHNLYREGGVWVLYLEAETGGSSNGQKTATDGKQDSTSTPPSRRKTLKLPEGVQFSSKYDSPHSFKTRTFKGINDLEAHLAAPRVAGCVGHELLLTFYVHLLFKHNIAHGLWDGLYASYVAMLRLGLGNAKVQFMTEYAKKRDSWKVEKIEPIISLSKNPPPSIEVSAIEAPSKSAPSISIPPDRSASSSRPASNSAPISLSMPPPKPPSRSLLRPPSTIGIKNAPPKMAAAI